MKLVKASDAEIQTKIFTLLINSANINLRREVAKLLGKEKTQEFSLMKAWSSKYTECIGRCPEKCSQGTDEKTKEKCIHCNGWGFVEAKL